ncbi:MAG TPA: amino acid permease [Pyrinomonadaceae bacterium]|nr:amino acid permease [Pyrinomonadaceae bacterium]
MSLFATKPISQIVAEAQESGEHTFKKTLSSLDLTMLGIGAIIGTGIFVLTGQAAGKHAGPAVIISMILAGIVSAFAALCYSEFAASVPISGSAYAYGYGTLGEFIAWIIGWDLILEYAFGAATVAVGWSGYVVSLFRDTLGINFPLSLSAPPGTVLKDASGAVVGTGVFNLPAALIAVAVTLLLIRGIKESASFNSLIVIVKVLVVVLFIVAGIGYVNMDNIGIGCTVGAPGCAQFLPYGFPGVVTGAAVIFFAYIGFDAVSTAAQEAKNPQRDMPIGILGSLAICTVLYILVAGIMVGLVDYKMLTNAAAPIAVAIDAALQKAEGTTMGTILAVFPTIIKVGAVLGLSSTMVVMTMGQPRVFYSMSKDGLLPSWAAKIHPKYQTPHITTAITGTIVAILAGFVPISLLGELVSIGTLFAFVIVGTGIIILRSSNPALDRPFKVPLSPFIPIATVVSAAYLMNSLPLDTWIRLIDWMAIGIVIYFAYSYSNSNLGKVSDAEANASVPASYTPPVAAIIAIVLCIALTIYQVPYLMGLKPEVIPINLGIRLFAWVITGVLIGVLMYGKGDRSGGRSAQVQKIGLIASLINLLVWIGITYWFFAHFEELHAK